MCWDAPPRPLVPGTPSVGRRRGMTRRSAGADLTVRVADSKRIGHPAWALTTTTGGRSAWPLSRDPRLTPCRPIRPACRACSPTPNRPAWCAISIAPSAAPRPRPWRCSGSPWRGAGAAPRPSGAARRAPAGGDARARSFANYQHRTHGEVQPISSCRGDIAVEQGRIRQVATTARVSSPRPHPHIQTVPMPCRRSRRSLQLGPGRRVHRPMTRVSGSRRHVP